MAPLFQGKRARRNTPSPRNGSPSRYHTKAPTLTILAHSHLRPPPRFVQRPPAFHRRRIFDGAASCIANQGAHLLTLEMIDEHHPSLVTMSASREWRTPQDGYQRPTPKANRGNAEGPIMTTDVGPIGLGPCVSRLSAYRPSTQWAFGSGGSPLTPAVHCPATIPPKMPIVRWFISHPRGPSHWFRGGRPHQTQFPGL